MSCKVAIIGGGPGGLMTAHLLQQYCPAPLETTIYEAGARLGGKILTNRFASAPVQYEGGAAELYDYSHLGEDPLRQLVRSFRLETRPMRGAAVHFNGQMLREPEDVGRIYGEPTREALLAFDQWAKQGMSPQEYYDADWTETSGSTAAQRTFEEELALVRDDTARRFLQCMVHSDVATEPHLTSASYGLQNYLMNDPAYMRLYTIDGGIEQLPKALAAGLDARVRMQERVMRVAKGASDRLRVFSTLAEGASDRRSRSEDFDFVVAALPNNLLPAIGWEGEGLDAAMRAHYIHHDYPAHYLRVSVLFQQPFWKQVLRDSYCMLDAFGGCCLYDESARGACGDYGVLGWLLAGNAAQTASNETDEALIGRVLDALPAPMQSGRPLFLEGRVHRWIGAVNGRPGGRYSLEMGKRHQPDSGTQNLFVVGDYLFDSTLNGVLDSADYVAEQLAARVQRVSGARDLLAAAAR